MVAIIKFLLLFGSLALIIGCASAACPKPEQENSPQVYLVSHGYHVGLILPTGGVINQDWISEAGFSKYRYLEVGWGDQGFYQARQITSGLTLRALFLPTPSVLHLVGFNQSVSDYFSESEVLTISISENNLQKLAAYIGNFFARDEKQSLHYLGPGIYGSSAFYQAKGSYYFPKTCNVWTARSLNAAGCSLSTLRAITASGLMSQLR